MVCLFIPSCRAIQAFWFINTPNSSALVKSRCAPPIAGDPKWHAHVQIWVDLRLFFSHKMAAPQVKWQGTISMPWRSYAQPLVQNLGLRKSALIRAWCNHKGSLLGSKKTGPKGTQDLQNSQAKVARVELNAPFCDSHLQASYFWVWKSFVSLGTQGLQEFSHLTRFWRSRIPAAGRSHPAAEPWT